MSTVRMSPRAARRLATLTAGALLAASPALAQGNLSTQGFGYPPGQLSTRALGSGGATGEIDGWSPLNPASIASFSARVLSFQIQPEFRQVRNGSETDRTTTARYPLVFGALPVGERWVVSASASTLLDRTWSTLTSATEQIGSDVVETTTEQSVNGAMNDLRLGIAWGNLRWLRVGVGLHAISGRNVVSISRSFPDSSKFAPFDQSLTVGFRGAALSGGAEVNLGDQASFGVSYRLGGRLRAQGDDTTYTTADVPDRFGISAAFTGIPGTVLAARAAHDAWSSMAPLGTGAVQPRDAWDTSVGAEVSGPRIANRAIMLRAGVRDRALPFEAAGREVNERSASFGIGTALSGGRVVVDMAAIYARRDAGLSITERAWTLSLGLSARP